MSIIKHLINRFRNINLIKRYNSALSKTIPNFEKMYNSNDVIVNQNSTELEVNTNNITSFIIKDLFPIVGTSPYPITEQLLMTSAVINLNPQYIFEWGTHLGISARIFHEVCKKYKIEAKIHSIDLPDDVEHIEHPGQKRGIKVKGISNVSLHQGDGLDISKNIISELNSDSKILFFLDGDHSYDSVTRELNGVYNIFPKADILVHDTFYQSTNSGYNI